MGRHTPRTYPDLKTFFDESGVTQAQFAKRINRSQSWVSKVVNGHAEPSIREALLIARLARVPLESLCRVTQAESIV